MENVGRDVSLVDFTFLRELVGKSKTLLDIFRWKDFRSELHRLVGIVPKRMQREGFDGYHSIVRSKDVVLTSGGQVELTGNDLKGFSLEGMKMSRTFRPGRSWRQGHDKFRHAARGTFIGLQELNAVTGPVVVNRFIHNILG